jgi:DNA modification methylase
MIYAQNERQALLCGDCLALLRKIPSNSVNCCVTSPPYFGLRDYGMDGQIGLEQTPDEYISKLVEVFREVKRVLRDDGTLWLNLGDSYAGSGRGLMGDGTPSDRGNAKQGTNRGTTVGVFTKPDTTGLKQKDLIGIPWRVAFALQADGWYLRQDIIWHKPNPMPESVKDRCTKAHEYIFLLSKSPKYYFDSEAIKEPYSDSYLKDKRHGNAKTKHENWKDYSSQGTNVQTPTQLHDNMFSKDLGTGKNKRSVWTVTTKPFKGAHFATFPPDLIEPCVLAGCPENGVVIDPFNGAGTVGVVSFKNNRNYVGVELNPEYCRITVERWAKNGNQN